MAEGGREEETWGSCEVVGAISEGTRRTSGPRSRYGDPVGNQMPRLLHCCTPIASRVTFALLPSLLFLISSFLPKQIFPSPPREKNTILFLSAVIRLRLIGGGFINGGEREEKNLREMTYRYSRKAEKEERFFVNYFFFEFVFIREEGNSIRNLSPLHSPESSTAQSTYKPGVSSLGPAPKRGLFGSALTSTAWIVA